jgi:amino acid transporter
MSTTVEPRGPEAQPRTLRRTLGVWGAIGVSLGLMAPSMAININPTAPAGLIGRAVPLMFVLATIGVLLVAYGFIRLCQHFNHAGSVYGFIGVTLGPRAGFVAGWALLGTYIAYAATTIAGVGLFGAAFLDSTGVWDDGTNNWIPISLAAFALVWLLAVTGTRLSARTLLTIEGATIGLILLVTVVVFAKLLGGDAPGGQTFTADVFTLPADADVSALFWAITFGFLSFAGYEVASTLGEETENPRRAIPLALLGTVIFCGLFYTVVSMAETMGFGTDAAGVEAFVGSSSLVGDLGAQYLNDTVGDLITLGAMFSAFGSALACTVGASRLLFAFGRDGFISERLGEGGGRDTPAIATGVIAVVVLAQVIGLRLFATENVIDIFFWTATYGTLSLLVAYVLSTIGAIRFLHLGERPRVPRWEIVIPLLALAFLFYTLYKNLYPVPDDPFNLFPYVVAAWILVAVAVVLLVPGLARRMGDRLRQEEGLVDPGPDPVPARR